MSNTKQVTIAAYRAIFIESFDYDLSEILQRIRSNLPPGSQILRREFFSQTAANFPAFPQTNEGVVMQLALYEEGAQRSLVKAQAANSGYDTSPMGAPDGSEFLSNEIALLVAGNVVLACALGNRLPMLANTIGQLADVCGIPFPPGCMALAPIPNELTLQRIRERGVSSVRFNANELVGTMPSGPPGLLATIFSSLSGPEAIQREAMVTEISIKPANKTSGILETTEMDRNDWVTRAAAEAHEDEDVSQYTIVLSDGSEWRDGELKLRRSIKLETDGSSYDVPQALQEMMNYHKFLKQNALIE